MKKHPSTRTLAKEIAHELMTVTGPRGRATECTRLQLMAKRPDGSEANMGGHCKQSVIHVIEEVLLRLSDVRPGDGTRRS